MTRDRSAIPTRRWIFGAGLSVGLATLGTQPALSQVQRIAAPIRMPKPEPVDHLFTPAINRGNLLAQHFEKMPAHSLRPQNVRLLNLTGGGGIDLDELTGKIRLLLITDTNSTGLQLMRDMARLETQFGNDTFELAAVLTGFDPATIGGNVSTWLKAKQVEGLKVWFEEDGAARLAVGTTAAHGNAYNFPSVLVIDEDAGIRGREIGLLMPQGTFYRIDKDGELQGNKPSFWERKEAADLCRALCVPDAAPFA